jgi:predicted transcriptional regulator
MARPATGRDPLVSFRLPEWLKGELTRIAAAEGISRSALMVRALKRYVAEYPANEVD